MKRFIFLLSSALAMSLPVSAIASQPLHPDQATGGGVAGFDHLFPVKPACRQLVQRKSEHDGWVQWGLNFQRDFIQVYGLEEMIDSEAHGWLQDAGICVIGGTAIDLDNPPLMNGKSANTDTPTDTDTDTPAAPTNAAAKAARLQDATGNGEPIPFDRALFLAGCAVFVVLGMKPEKETPARDLQMSVAPIRTPATMPTSAPMVPQATIDDGDIETAIGEVLTAPLYTRIWLGGQRSGKSFAASRISLYLKQQNKTKIYAINLALVKNPEYWQHADAAAIADLTSHNATEQIAIKAIKQAQAVLDEFKRHKNALLLIDEWTIIGATTFRFNEHLKPFIDDVCSTITTLSSRGLQADQAIWLIAPHCRLDFLEKSAKALKLCKLCLVAANPEKPFEVDGNRISFDGELFDQVKNNWRDLSPPPKGVDAIDSNRIAFINGQWLPLGSIEVTRNQAVTDAEPHSVTTVTACQDSDSALIYARLSEVCNLTVTEVTGALTALSQGVSKSQIIKNIWGYTGRNYSEYSERFDQLQQLTEVTQDV